MDKSLCGISAYDPSEVSLTVYDRLSGASFSPYGYSEFDKIWYEGESLFISIQVTSDCNKVLKDYSGKSLGLKLSHTGNVGVDSLGHVLEGRIFRVELQSFTLSGKIESAIWKFYRA